jgi:hydroxymethylpyrimidine pyrophosphatase-like HAD family hydrolase
MPKNKNAWVFDIDGVLTDLETREVSQELLLVISKINTLKEPVAFVTGRSFTWVKERILGQLAKYSNIDLSLIFCSCEKGGVRVFFEDSQTRIEINEKLVVPKKIQESLKILLEEEFSKVMFYDPKLTMATTEAREDVANVEFRKQQKILDRKLQNIVNKYNLSKSLKLDSASIATDIESVNVSKKIGAADFLQWLTGKSTNPDHFYTFGDREADIEVPVFLYLQGHRVTCVFTGGETELKKHDYPFELIITSRLYDQGAVNFFRDHKNLLPAGKS